ncbi:CASP-like protein 4D [Parasponia andersonii]|uniref:CASP-like protein n=1 Tax=Parasponia andersonii TaxID=3476 RepID=A0A2P5ABF2_PARAD|nr:CASP-like protein 4D [Parasponia andersonii]
MDSTSSSNISWKLAIATIVLRFITIALLSVSFTILNDDILGTKYYRTYDDRSKTLQFRDTAGYQYMVATILLGIAHSVVQIVLAIYLLIRKNKDANKLLLFQFYGDKVISYLLVSGAIGGYIATDDKEEFFGKKNHDQIKSTLNKSNSSATLLLLGFICTAVSSVISSYTLPKRSSTTTV